MKDEEKTKGQLVSELVEMRQRIAELEASEVERRRVEESVRDDAAHYRLLAENITDAIWTMDMNLHYTYVSPSIMRMRGYSAEEVLTHTLQDTLTPASVEVATKAFAEELAAENMATKDLTRSRTLELEMNCKDGSTVWTEVKMIFLRDQDTKPVGILGVTRDITERKWTEKLLQGYYEREKALRQSLEREMTRRADFTRALVHELKTPLTPMISSSRLLVEEAHGRAILRLAENIREGTLKLDSRIDELLEAARGELGLLELNLTEVDLRQLLQRLVVQINPVVSERGQSLALGLPPSLPRCWVDEGRLERVVLNLLNNASKFTPQGETIGVRAWEENDSIIVEVQDAGPGISEEEQLHLFEVYYRGEGDRPRRDGLGLGLVLCKAAVELHGGRIWVESHEGEGSVFSFSIPVKRTPGR